MKLPIKFTMLVSLLLAGLAGFSQIPDCTKFREGKFRIADSHTGTIVLVERNSIYQTETSEALKAVLRFRISWQDNCSYTLKLDKVIRNENKINFPYDLEIKAKIVKTSAGSYTQQTTSSYTNGTYNVEATKL